MKIIFLIMIGLSILHAEFTRDNTTNIVSDSTTGLEWQDDVSVSSTQKAWQEAIEYCEDLVLDSKSDWRLPNRNELVSIVDRSKYNPAINSAFANVSSSLYWSSTTLAYSTGHAWYVDFNVGAVRYNLKTGSYYVRCVRGGE